MVEKIGSDALSTQKPAATMPSLYKIQRRNGRVDIDLPDGSVLAITTYYYSEGRKMSGGKIWASTPKTMTNVSVHVVRGGNILGHIVKKVVFSKGNESRLKRMETFLKKNYGIDIKFNKYGLVE